MAQHGYAREYDEEFGRGERAWHNSDWDRGTDWRDRERDFMFGVNERDYRGDRSAWEDNRDWPQRNREIGDDYGRERGYAHAGDWNEEQRSFSSHPDDHYRSWRRKQIDALDRDYADYCREREQQFHNEFDNWRSQRHGNPQPLRTGMTQTGLSHDPSGELELTNAMPSAPQNDPDATGTATLGTTSGSRTRK